LQAPSVPQLAWPASAHWFSGSCPAAIGEQTPRLPASAHDRQVPVQAVPQQTPCWQKPLAHSPGVVQSTPVTFLPQIVPLQTFPAVQSALVAHAARQVPVVALHIYEPHGCCVPGVHTPAPSQRPARVAVAVEQLGGTQVVPFAYGWQAPAPSHEPLVPQVEPWSAHWPSGSSPAGTLVQVPALPETAHDWHMPVQVVWQQTPCAQIPELQSSLVAQVPPSGRLPQLPPLHEFGAVQSASTVHASRHLSSVPHM
jgi:hypothetical protein